MNKPPQALNQITVVSVRNISSQITIGVVLPLISLKDNKSFLDQHQSEVKLKQRKSGLTWHSNEIYSIRSEETSEINIDYQVSHIVLNCENTVLATYGSITLY